MDQFRHAVLTRLQLNERRTNFIFQDLRRQFPRLTERQLVAELWACLADRLVFLAAESLNGFGNWDWVLTERGRHLIESTQDFEPRDFTRYLKNLSKNIPDIDLLIQTYVREALTAYSADCYLASSVMLGVASERAFQLLGEAFADWLPANESQKFREVFERPRQTYISKFSEFRRRVEPMRDRLPAEFSDNMALTLDSVMDLLRITRNEAGHPTGRRIDDDEAYINLQMFGRYLKKLYDLRRFFLTNAASTPG